MLTTTSYDLIMKFFLISDFLLNSSVVQEIQFPNTDIKFKKNKKTVELIRKFTNSDNDSQIFCLAKQINGSTNINITKSKNLTLIFNGSNLTNVIEYFRNYQNISKYLWFLYTNTLTYFYLSIYCHT